MYVPIRECTTRTPDVMSSQSLIIAFFLSYGGQTYCAMFFWRIASIEENVVVTNCS